MRTKLPLFLLPLVAVLSGCGASGAGSAMPSSPAALAPSDLPSLQGAAKAPIVYSDVWSPGNVDVFKLGRYKKTKRTITSGLNQPTGEAVDSSGNLYVANQGCCSTGENVQVYAPGASTPFRTYQGSPYGPIYDPFGIAISKSGSLYVADDCCSHGSGYNVQGVVVYAPGSTNPSGYLYLPGYVSPFFLTLDAKGDLFASSIVSSGQGAVYEFTGGSGSATNLGLQGLGNVSGIVFDKNGNLLVADWTNDVVDVFPSKSTTYSRQIKLPAEPFGLAFTKSYKQLFVSNGSTDTPQFEVVDYASGKILKTVGKSCSGWCSGMGIAVSPAAFP